MMVRFSDYTDVENNVDDGGGGGNPRRSDLTAVIILLHEWFIKYIIAQFTSAGKIEIEIAVPRHVAC